MSHCLATLTVGRVFSPSVCGKFRETNVLMDMYSLTCHSCRMIILSMFIVSCLAVPSRTLGIDPSTAAGNKYMADLRISYKDKEGLSEGLSVKGRYSTASLKKKVEGKLIHVRDKNLKNESNTGCSDFDIKKMNIPQRKERRWVALIKRGQCAFEEKLSKATKQYNASAVIIYNADNSQEKEYIDMKHSEAEYVAVFVQRRVGMQLIGYLTDKNINDVTIHITPGDSNGIMPASISKTSVLFVSISFIVLMIISLAWLVFYYIQRFRYAHAKERLSRRLANAAKKAISRIPQKTVKTGDKELERDYDQCAVCIEVYKSADVIRILPCKHVFHKSCVDPWLMEQRSCPMCKMDILRAFGLQLNGSEESVVHVEAESEATASAIEPEPLSSPEDPPTTTSASSCGPKLMHFSHPSVQFHSAPDRTADHTIDPSEETHLMVNLPPDTVPNEESTETHSLIRAIAAENVR